MEQHPSEAPPGASVRLAEFAAVQSILMRASIEAQARRAGWDPSTPIGEFLDRAPAARAGGASLLNNAEVQNPSSLAAGDQNAQQREGLDTVEANRALGLPDDARDYGIGAQVLYDLGLRRVRFLTNNPRKRVGMEGYGLTVVEQVPITASPNPHNIRYLRTKRDKMGHTTLLASEETRDAESA